MIPTLEGLPLVIHSTAVWLLAELGIVGFLIFAVPFMHIFFKEWKCAPIDQTSAFIVLCLAGFAVMSGPGDMLINAHSGWSSVRRWLSVDRNQTSRFEIHRTILKALYLTTGRLKAASNSATRTSPVTNAATSTNADPLNKVTSANNPSATLRAKTLATI
jgi:hypothetical protein